MIKHWIEHSVDEPKVYWICFTQSDQEKVDRLFESSSFRDKVRSVLTSRPDLLLYELYQQLQLSLPPGGLTYEFSHVLPPQRRKPFDNPEAQVEAVVVESKSNVDVGKLVSKYPRRMLRDATVMASRDAILDAILRNAAVGDRSVLVSSRKWTPKYRFTQSGAKEEASLQKAEESLVFQPTIINSSGGIVRASSLAATTLASSFYKKVFWIELQDYLDVDSLLRDFLRSLALRCGQYHARHVTMHPIAKGFAASNDSPEKFLSRLVDHISAAIEEYRTDPKSVSVLLNGRDSYGCGSGLISSPWRQGNLFQQLHIFIEALGRVGIPTVYFPCSAERATRKLGLIRNLKVEDPVDKASSGTAPQLLPLAQSWPSDNMPEGKANVEEIANDLSVFNDIVRDTLHEFYEMRPTKDGEVAFKLRQNLPLHTFRKLEFLYALTLFRHSRHANAIGAEGAFFCPHRFQSRSVDNDFVRAIQADRWSRELCDNGVFFTKPGGALWMHRDIREAMHRVLETTDISKISLRGRQHANFRETRGRTHFWIGEWYYKAYCSSGHLTPVIEAVYHFLSSAIYSQFAVPKRELDKEIVEKSLAAYRCMMFEPAVVQASKMLLLSWRSIELWQASSANVAWLSPDHRDPILKILRKVIATISKETPFRERLDVCVDQFKRIHSSLHDAVLLEGGRYERGVTSWSTPVSIMMRLSVSGDVTDPMELRHGIDVIRRPETSEDNKDFWSEIKAVLDDSAHELWDAMLSVARGNSSDIETFGKAKAKWKAQATSAEIQNLIWFLGEAAYLCLRRAKLRFHASGKVHVETWLVSTICCNLGIDLCKHLSASNLDYEINSKIKMHSIYAIGLANIGRFFEANRHLNDAQGILSKWRSASGEDHAIISIRRAEVKLTECYWISRFLDSDIDLTHKGEVRLTSRRKVFAAPSYKVGAIKCWNLGLMAELLKSSEPDAKILPPNIFEAFRKSRPVGIDAALAGSAKEKAVGGKYADTFDHWKERAQTELRYLLSAVLDEAVRSLEIAEKNLGGSSQSSLWWSRLHTLRMRVYGLLRFLPEDAELCIVFRKQSADTGIFKNFLSAKRIAGEDDFRRLRALKYFLRANRWYCRHRAPDVFDENGTSKKGELDDLKMFLPDSVTEAKKLANELWQAKKKSPKGDLLREAIERCLKEFPEVAPESRTIAP